MFSVHTWIHIITVTTLAMVFKEYRTLQLILHEEHRVKLWNSGPLPVSPSSYSIPQNPFDVTTAHLTLDTSQRQMTNVLETIESEGSSVWCQGLNHTRRLCQFKNVCFVPDSDSFIFFNHENSVISGISSERFSPTLLDWSSISDHNRLFFNYMDVPAAQAHRIIKQYDYISSTVLTFKRFLPDNLMHIFHDDLLPAFVTIRKILKQSMAPFELKLLFMDNLEQGPYWYLYESLLNNEPMLKSEMSTEKPTCFKDLHVGVSKDTVWYDHGFKEPQRPVLNFTVNALTIKQFTNHVIQNLGIRLNPTRDNTNHKSAVLMLRRENRIILNEKVVISELTSLGFQVNVITEEDMVFPRAIQNIKQASLILAMHSSMMILTMFASPKTVIIECFAFALNPTLYTLYKTLAELPGMDLQYESWANRNEENSLAHADRPWHQGGIKQLPFNAQLRIRAAAYVAAHKCCYDPHYLYRYYQDTAIDVNALERIVTRLFNNSLITTQQSEVNSLDTVIKQAMPPGAVQELFCRALIGKTHPVLQINWRRPWNVQYLEHEYILYEVLVQESNSKSVYKWSLSSNFHEIMDGIEPNRKYFIWVRALLNDTLPGPFNTDEVSCET